MNEIRQEYARATTHPDAVDATDLRPLAVSYHGRWAATAGPIVFVLFALALLLFTNRREVRVVAAR